MAAALDRAHRPERPADHPHRQLHLLGPAGVPRFQTGRIFLLGDAVHLTPSFIGQGLAAAVRSDRICQAMGSTATPRLKAGALQPSPRRFLPSGLPPALRIGGLIPNPLVSAGNRPPVRLDAILAGRTAVLTARRPDAGLVDFGRQHGLVLVRISSSHAAGTPGRTAADPDAGWIDVRLAGDRRPAGLRALAVLGSNPALTVVVRPDRVVAAVAPRGRLPRLPWPIPATARRGSPVTAHPPAHPDHARPFASTR